MGLIIEARSPLSSLSTFKFVHGALSFESLVAAAVVMASSEEQETGVARPFNQMDQTSS